MSSPEILQSEKIDHLHLNVKYSVQITDSLKNVIQLMKDKNIGCLTICDGKKVVGVFTERDLLLRILNHDIDYDSSIEQWMTPNPITAAKDASIGSVIEMMAKNGIRHVPWVNKKNEFIGQISVRNIVDCIVEYHPQNVINLPPNINQIPTSKEGG